MHRLTLELWLHLERVHPRWCLEFVFSVVYWVWRLVGWDGDTMVCAFLLSLCFYTLKRQRCQGAFSCRIFGEVVLGMLLMVCEN